MAALTLSVETYRDKIFGGWQGKSAGLTLGAAQRGQRVPGRNNFYSPVPGQPVASLALDFPLVWIEVLEQVGPEVVPEDLAVAWLEHLDYSQDEFGHAALNLRRGLPPPASGAHSNWFRHATGGVMRADFWAMVAPGAPQVAAAYAYHDAKLDHSEEGVWAAMFLAALGSASFFLTDPLTLLTIGLAMIPRTCRTARAVKAALAAAQRGAAWLEARESVLNEVGHSNFTDSPQNMGFLTIGLFYANQEFGNSLCAAVNCGYDSELVGGALGAILGFRYGGSGLPADWTRPIGDIVIPGLGMRDFDAPMSITEVSQRMVEIGRRVVAARCPDIAITETPEPMAAPAAPAPSPEPATTSAESALPPEPAATPTALETAVSPVAQETPSDAPAATALPTEPAAPPAPEIATSDVVPPLLPENAPALADTTEGEKQGTGNEVAISSSPPFPISPTPDTQNPTPAFKPQSVSESPVASVTPEIPTPDTQHPTPDTQSPTPLAPDLVSAIAWADSALVKPLLVTSPNAFPTEVGDFHVVMETGDSPTIAFGQPKTLSFSVGNHGPNPFTGRVSLLAPPGWQISAPPAFGQRQYIAANGGTLRGDFTLQVIENQGRIDIANTVVLRFTPEGGVPTDAEFVLMGASCWWTVGPFGNFDGEGFDRSYLPEDRPGLQESYVSRTMQAARWEKHAYLESVLDLEPIFKGSAGVCYGQTVLRSPTTREARLVANTNSGVKVWLNGALAFRRYQRAPFRPLIGEGPWAMDIALQAGDNRVMVKWVRGAEPFEFSLTVSDRQGRGLPEVGNTSW